MTREARTSFDQCIAIADVMARTFEGTPAGKAFYHLHQRLTPLRWAIDAEPTQRPDRVKELLEANNREVERRRDIQAELTAAATREGELLALLEETLPHLERRLSDISTALSNWSPGSAEFNRLNDKQTQVIRLCNDITMRVPNLQAGKS